MRTTIIFLVWVMSFTVLYEILRADDTVYTRAYPTEQVRDSVKSIQHKVNGFQQFANAVGQRESSGRYEVVNRFGYAGKYQFGSAALKDVGVTDKDQFLKNPEVQERAFIALCKVNKYRLRNYIDKYEGKYINGIKITESGLLAASHLVGAGKVKRYLRSNGKKSSKDGNGISLEHYLKIFEGYQLDITANRIASI